VKTKDDL
jgi:hypothetical protein